MLGISRARTARRPGRVVPGFRGVNDNEGQAVFTSPNVNVTVDANNNGLQNLGKVQGPSAYAVDSTGLGAIPSGCSVTATSTTCNVLFYFISPTQVAVLDGIGSTPPDIHIGDHQLASPASLQPTRHF